MYGIAVAATCLTSFLIGAVLSMRDARADLFVHRPVILASRPDEPPLRRR
ncbi:hypothetical protein [Nocardia stercoris]|nr:hypothetical protein [Nocardia stercoris]